MAKTVIETQVEVSEEMCDGVGAWMTYDTYVLWIRTQNEKRESE